MKAKPIVLWSVLVGYFFCSSGHAETLSYLFELAVSNEPAYLSAMTSVQTAKARTDQALGGLLPQINLSANVNYNTRNYKTLNSNIAAQNDYYRSDSEQLSFTQPIWNHQNFIGLHQATVATFQAEQQLLAAEQELLVKVVSAWIDVLSARDQVLLTQQQIAVAKFRQKVARREFELGSMGRPEIDDAEAKLAQTNADNAVAEADVNVKRAALEQIVGNLAHLTPTFIRKNAVLANLSHGKLTYLLMRVEESNHKILAAKHAYDAASDEVNKQSAGHQPTLDLVASYGRNSQNVGSFPGQSGYNILQGSVGLQLKIPLYSGGAQSAKVEEAVSMKEKARLDIEVARREAILAVKQAWYGWHAVFKKSKASEETMKAANTLLSAATAATNNGLKSELDVLEAQQKLSEAQRDFYKNRYEQVINFVKIKSILGVLTYEDITALDALFIDKPLDANLPAWLKFQW